MKPLTQEQIKEIRISSILERLVLEQITPYMTTFKPVHISNPFGSESWDCTFYSGETNNRFVSVCELKIKEGYGINQFDSALIKQNKFCTLTALTTSSIAKEKKTQPTYINVFNDGLVVYNLSQLPANSITWTEKEWARFKADWSNTKIEFIGEVPFAASIDLKTKMNLPLKELRLQATAIYNQYHSTYPTHIRYFLLNDPRWKAPN